MTNSFHDKILSTIEEKNVKPKARWIFLFKEYLLWGITACITFLGIISVAVITTIIQHHDWDIVEKLGHTPFGFFLLALPYTWIILFALFIFVADYNIRHTKRGYKLSLPILLGSIIGVSVIGGVSLHAVGVGSTVDHELSERIPLYQHIGNRRAMHLLHPEQGVLAGKVIVMDNDIWEIRDIRAQRWVVYVEEAEILGETFIRIGSPVRIIGEWEDDEDDEYIFYAEEIRPLRPSKQEEYKPYSYTPKKRLLPPPPKRQ